MESMVIKNKAILVTGGTGFIGSHLVERLLDFTSNIIVVSKTLRADSYFAQSGLHKKVTFEPIDITNKTSVERLSDTYTFDFIFHLAAQTIVTHAYNEPYTNFNTNIMGTINLLELARNKKIDGIIIASSDKAYGKTIAEYKENSRLQGDHPYDVSKSAADLIGHTYFKTYNTPIVTTRFGNVYGPGDLHFDRIIPGICDAIIYRKKLQIRSDGTYIRDYLYVKDVVEGYIFLMKNFQNIKGEAFNFSSNDSYSVIDLIKKIKKEFNYDIPYEILNTAKNEIPYQHLNDEKIKKIGWKNNFSLSTSFPQTLSWYKEYCLTK